MERVLRQIHADEIYRRGILGQGTGVAILDTGIYPHRDLKSQIHFFRDFVGQKTLPYDDNGHGTHVAGIIAGAGRQPWHGIAPAAHLYIYKVLDQNGNGKIEHTCRAIDEILRWNQKMPGVIRILNISVGMMLHVQPKAQKELLDAVEKAWDHGIVVVAAAGNNGPKAGSVTSPGISRKIITVGSLEERKNQQPGLLQASDYSGRGPTGNCIVKPELLMPGTNILSCANRSDGYVYKSGTSMAAPVLSGMLALFLSAYPDLGANEVKMRLFYASSRGRNETVKNGWGTVTLDRLFAQ